MCTPFRINISRYLSFVFPVPRRHIVEATSKFLENTPDEIWIIDAKISPRTLDAMLLRPILRDSVANFFNTICLLIGVKKILPEEWYRVGTYIPVTFIAASRAFVHYVQECMEMHNPQKTLLQVNPIGYPTPSLLSGHICLPPIQLSASGIPWMRWNTNFTRPPSRSFDPFTGSPSTSKVPMGVSPQVRAWCVCVYLRLPARPFKTTFASGRRGTRRTWTLLFQEPFQSLRLVNEWNGYIKVFCLCNKSHKPKQT